MKIFKQIVAFTLAETLIVMGVIGIVSALTLPNLNSSTGDKEKVAKVKKLYQNLSDSIGRAEATYGPIDEWFVNDTTDAAKVKRFAERLSESMKVTKTCAPSATGCFTSGKFKKVSGIETSTSVIGPSYYTYILPDGSSIAIGGGANNLATSAYVFIDIDGPTKGQFKYGVDLFDFNIKNGALNSEYLSTEPVKSCIAATNDCGLWIINNGNMDYTKVDNNAKCKNDIVLSLTNTTCK